MRILWIALLSLSLVACGFHPRGALRLPAGTEAIALRGGDPYGALIQGLEQDLRRQGLRIATGEEPALTLRLLDERWEQRSLSVESGAQVREYRVRYRVAFELVAADGQPLVARRELVAESDYVHDNLAASAASNEQDILREELGREIRASLLRQLDLALNGVD
jgi:LPS-assembly lipoprotein